MKKKSIFFLSTAIIFASYADQATPEQFKKIRALAVEQAIMAQTCATLLVHDFADDKVKQANCQQTIDRYFEMVHDLRKMEAHLKSKTSINA